MSLYDVWTIENLQGDGGIIDLVTFRIEFTDQSYPGIKDYSGGTIAIGNTPPLEAATASHEQIVAAVKDALGIRWDEMRDFHQSQIAFEYARQTAESYDPTHANPAVTAAAVDMEADRRIAEGVAYGGKVYQMDPKAKTRITGAATLAGFAIAQGAEPGDMLWHGGTDPFQWITADNSIATLDAQSMFALGQAAADWEAQHVFAARALKDMNPIPLDFQDDVHWP